MNKKELIVAIANITGLTKRATEATLDGLAVVAGNAVRAGEDVEIPRLARIKRAFRSARAGRNPKTGEAIVISAKTTVKITPAKALVDAAGGL